MNLRLLISLAIMMGVSAEAAGPGSPTRSASGQFSVLTSRGAIPPSASAPLLIDSELLRVDPSLLTVSAERLRQHMTRELQDPWAWRDQILFTLRPANSFEAEVQVVAEWQGQHWLYRVSMPEYIAQDRFIRALVEVNLMEMANRGSSGRAVEVPAWLVEGLTAQLIASRSIELVLPPPKLQVGKMRVTPWVLSEKNYQPLTMARLQLSTNAPMSIEQLSWPPADSLRGRRGEVYRQCAHLLLNRLLVLPDGHGRLNHFISILSQHYNWQVGFLEAYNDPFPTLLDFEKWWALQVAHFTGRDLGATYPYLESIQRLKETVQCPVQIRLSTNDLPLRTEAPLQTIIREWEGNQQRSALEQVHSDLTLLRTRIAPELVGLLDDYRLTLGYYLQNRDRTGIYLPKGSNRQVAMNRLIARTLRRLDQHDASLAALTPAPTDNAELAGSPR